MSTAKESVLEVENLTKIYGRELNLGFRTFGRRVIANRNVNFSVKEGEIFGFLGPNGAGKTTTIRSIMGYLNIQSGIIKVLGLDHKEDALAIRKRIGYLPGDVALYSNYTGLELIKLFNNFRPTDPEFLKRLRSVFKVNLKVRIRDLSKGNKQQAAIIAVMASNPELLILDEPSAGLDPLMTSHFHNLLLELKEEGKTVFLSSHQLWEVQTICKRVGIIKEGFMVLVEKVKELRKKSLQSVYVEFKDPETAPKKSDFDSLPTVLSCKQDDGGFTIKVTEHMNEILPLLAPHKVKRITIEDASLEDIFLKFYRTAEDEYIGVDD
jgi:ABC-2 type transport system ATP-binding protein